MALIDRSIGLTERGNPAIVPESDWQSLDLEEPCRILSEKGIIGLKRIGAFRIVEPRQFVGHLRLPGRSITISPYAKELFTSLHRFVTTPPAKRVDAEEVQRTVTDYHILDPAIAFYKALSDAAHHGFPFLYERTSSTTSRPRGRLLINETLRSLHTHGISHKVVCSYNVRQLDANIGSIVSTVASLLYTGYNLTPTLQLRINRLVDLFEDSPTLATQQALEKASTLLNIYSEQRELVRLLRISQAILANEQIVWDTEIPLKGGECRFCNMDRLWELAIWTALKEVSISHNSLAVEFHPFASTSVRLLTDGGPEIDPDIIIFRDDKPFIVVDAKYSEARNAVADDIYQIVCYTERVKAAKGALVYLSEKDDWSESFGRTESGSLILAGGINSQRNIALNIVALARSILSAS